jgi:HEAT repeat protein
MCLFCRALLSIAIALIGMAAATQSLAATDVPAEQMVVTLLANDDPAFRAVALDRIRHGIEGEAATSRVASVLATLPAPRQGELIRALADRGDKAAIPAITAQLLQSPDATVRAAAVAALGLLGGGKEVALLKKSLAAADPEKSAARRALVILRGDDAVEQLVEAAQFGEPALRATFIDILAERRARAVLSKLTAMTAEADPAVRSAAMRAIGVLGGAAEVPGMIAGLLKAAPGGERQDAERAVVTVCAKNRGHEEAAKVFLERFRRASEADKESLLPVLGGIGGSAALVIVDELIASSEPAKRQLGLKAISRWPDATVSQRLLDLVAKAKDQPERDLLLGALIRIAPLPDNKLNDEQKLELVEKTMALCQKDDERARLIERANAIRTIESFRFVTAFLDSPALAEPACKSVVELAHHRQLRDANKDEFAKALDTVIATTKNAELVERANAYKAGKTWERKKS